MEKIREQIYNRAKEMYGGEDSERLWNVIPENIKRYYEPEKIYTYKIPPHKLAQYKSYGVNFDGNIKFRILCKSGSYKYLINPSTMLVTLNYTQLILSNNAFVNCLFALDDGFFKEYLSILQMNTYISNLKYGKAKLPIFSKNYDTKFVIGKNNISVNHANKTVTIFHCKNATNWQISLLIKKLYRRMTIENIAPILKTEIENDDYPRNKVIVSNIGSAESSTIVWVNRSSVSISPMAAAYNPHDACNMATYILGIAEDNVRLKALDNTAYANNLLNLNTLLHYKFAKYRSAVMKGNFVNLNY